MSFSNVLCQVQIINYQLYSAVDENRTHALGFKNYHLQKKVFKLKLQSERLRLKGSTNVSHSLRCTRDLGITISLKLRLALYYCYTAKAVVIAVFLMC